jgi:hypothetical protein
VCGAELQACRHQATHCAALTGRQGRQGYAGPPSPGEAPQARHGSLWPHTVRVDGHGTAGTVDMDRSLGAARHRRQRKLSRGLVSQGRQVWKGVMRSELLGLRTAGSAWSGSSPAVCESAWTRQAWGAWPISHWHGRYGVVGVTRLVRVWHGRIGMDREERCGQVRSGRHGVARPIWDWVARQAWFASYWPAITRQARLRELRLSTCGNTRQAVLGGQGSTDPNGKAGKACHGGPSGASPGRCRMASPVGARNGMAGMALNGWTRHCRIRSALLGLVWLGRQLTTTLPTARHGRQCEDGGSWICSAGTSRHGSSAHHGRQRVARVSRSGLAFQVKAGMALLDQARLSRPRWTGNGGKSRQAPCYCQSAA